MDPRGSPSPEYLREYSGGTLIAVAIVFIVLGLLFVGLRELARHRTKAAWGWDDYLVVPALVVNIGLCVHGIVMVAVAGVGHHLEAVLMFHPHQIVLWAKSIYALEMIYLPAVALPKLSILSLYFRIFPNKVFRSMTLVIVAIVLLNWLAFLFASTFQCSPVAYQWDKSIEGGSCFDILLFYRMVNVPNIVTDIAMLILPMPVVWKLHASRPRKVGLTICFLAGGVGIIASCVRLVVFSNSNAFHDNTWQSVSLVSWTIVEPGMYLIAACLPGLRPFFSQMVPKAIVTKLTRNSFSGHNNTGHENDNKPQGGFQRLDAPFERVSSHDGEDTPIELQPAAGKQS